MPEISLTLDGLDEAIRDMEGLQKQLPFAASVGLNRTADDFQAAMRGRVQAKFTLRRPGFVLNTIKRERSDFATKAKLVAMVRIDPKSNFLAKFEEGGSKRPAGSGTLAIPVPRLNQPNLVIRRSDPLHLSKLPGSLTRGGRTRTRSRFGVSRGVPVFAITDREGNKLIVMNVGSTIRTLWTFKRAVPIPADLSFFATAQRIVAERWGPNILGAIDVALRSRR